MSAGAFDIVRYETDLGNIVPIRLQPETLQATFNSVLNAAGGTGATTFSPGFPSAMVSKSRRGLGIHCRTVNVRITAGLPSGYLNNQTYRIPCPNKTVFNGVVRGQTAGYLGGTGIVVSTSGEDIN